MKLVVPIIKALDKSKLVKRLIFVRKKDGSVHTRQQWVAPGDKLNHGNIGEPKINHENGITRSADVRFDVEPHDQKKWEKQIEFHLNGSRPEDRNIEMGKTPFVLSQIGLKELPLEIAPRVLDKVMGPEDQIKHGHGLSKEIVSQILEGLTDPIAVMGSLTQKGTFVVLTSILDHQKKPIIVSIHPGRRSGRNQVNEVMSFYGKDNFKDFWKRCIQEVKYFDNEKGIKWLLSIGVQFPKEEAFNASSGSIILKSDIVKKSGPASQNDQNLKKSQISRMSTMLLLVPRGVKKSIAAVPNENARMTKCVGVVEKKNNGRDDLESKLRIAYELADPKTVEGYFDSLSHQLKGHKDLLAEFAKRFKIDVKLPFTERKAHIIEQISSEFEKQGEKPMKEYNDIKPSGDESSDRLKLFENLMKNRQLLEEKYKKCKKDGVLREAYILAQGLKKINHDIEELKPLP